MELFIFIVLILLIVCCECGAQYNANMYRHKSNLTYLIAGGLLYFLVVYFLSEAHKHAKMGVVNSIWSGLSVVSIALVGYVFFNQTLRFSQICAMSVVMIGVVYLALDEEPEPLTSN